MAATAYGLSAVILVFHFGNLANLTVSASNQFEETMNHETVSSKAEETNESGLLLSDNTEYALISPDNHILQTITETVDELPTDMILHVTTNKYPLGQLSISPVTSEDSFTAVTMAILASQEDLLLTTVEKDQVLETLALDKGITVGNVDSTESKVETTKETTSVTPSDEEISNEALNDETLSSDLVSSETAKDKEEADVVVNREADKEDNKVSDKEVNKDADKEDVKEGKNEETKEDAKETLSVSDISVPSNLTLTMNKAMKLSLSADEKEVLQRIVEAEATGEDIYGKILVANVVINRVNSDEFPDTISEVVFQKIGGSYQFSPTKDGRYWSVKVSKETIKAVDRALSGEDYSEQIRKLIGLTLR
jgi:N-acetylmuramoyl-L-alanine amidase